MAASAAKKRSRAESLAHCSADGIWRFLNDGTRRALNKSGAFKREVARRLAPYRACFLPVEHPSIHGTPLVFYVADVKRILSEVAASSPLLLTLVDSAARKGESLHVVLSMDETTAGNVLQTEARQKAMIWYMTLAEYEDAAASPSAWLPVAVVSQPQVKASAGGPAGLMASFLQAWVEQNLQEPFQIQGRQVKLLLTCFVADHDAQRQAWSAKGAAGLKPCVMCANCVNLKKAGRDDASVRELYPISHARFKDFQQHNDEELANILSHCLARKASGAWTCAEIAFREKMLGFVLNDRSIWTKPDLAALMPLSKNMTDALHCYWANGICSLEINFFLQSVQEALSVTIQDLKRTVLDMGLERSSSRRAHGQTRWWVNRLFTESFFTGDTYKGSGTQTVALCSLLCFLTRRLWWHVEALGRQARCFIALCECSRRLLSISRTKDYRGLHDAQRNHQALFAEVYPDKMRPKHHYRLHLPEHYSRFGMVMTTWPTESKHRAYKGSMSRRVSHFICERDGGAEFSKQLLPRLLLKHIADVRENPLLSQSMHELRAPLPDEAFRAQSGWPPVLASSYCRVGLPHLRKGDLLLWGSQQEFGCRLDKCLDRAGMLYLLSDEMALQHVDEGMRIFSPTGRKKLLPFHKMQPLELPEWTCHQADTFVILL